jgi:hypothetical protein
MKVTQVSLHSLRWLAAACALAAAPATFALGVVPDFATVVTSPTQAPGVWYTDRYAPAGFANVGTQFGRSDVLGIDIAFADSQGQRSSSFPGGFYNTQGRKHDVSGSGVVLATADLYVPKEWGSADTEGFRRTDLWGTLTTGDPGAPVDASFIYPIVGFTNFGGAARFRGWDGSIGWQDFASAVNYDAWNTLAFEFDPAAQTVKYFVNGVLQYTDSNLAQSNTSFGPVMQIDNVMLQAFNFAEAYDPGNTYGNAASSFANPSGGYAYRAHWSATQAIPEPGTVAQLLAGLGLLATVAARRRAQRRR